MTTYRPYQEDVVKPNLSRILNQEHGHFHHAQVDRSQSFPLQSDPRRYAAPDSAATVVYDPAPVSAPVSAVSPSLALPDTISAPQTSLPALAAEVSKRMNKSPLLQLPRVQSCTLWQGGVRTLSNPSHQPRSQKTS
jgi:hypothetical protein